MAAYTVANVQAAMEYRISFWVQIFTMVANDSLWLFFWVSYFRQYPLVHGWQSTDIVVIWAVAACGFGISMGFFGNARNLATLIMNGGLDAYLGMPRNVLLHVCVRSDRLGRYALLSGRLPAVSPSRPAAHRRVCNDGVYGSAHLHLVCRNLLFPGLFPGQYGRIGTAAAGNPRYLQHLSHEHL